MYQGSLGGVSNAEDWQATFALINDDNSSFSVTGADIRLRVCREGNSSAAVLQAQTSDSTITIASDGSSFSWDIPITTMQNLRPDVYNVFVRVFINNAWTQLISGTVTVIDGGPTS